jgi:uncharacterized membrane protein YedE/YeeE
MENFTPWSAFAGGLLIGTSAALLLVLNGRIAGIAGIAGGLLSPGRGDIAWRVAFVIGLLVAPLAYWMVGGTLPSVQIEATTGTLVAAGLLVGFGTRLGAGCTSGHGVCGLARLSRRSILATGIFMLAAILTVLIKNQLTGA